MEQPNLKAQLEQLLSATAKELLKRVEDGTATAGDIMAAIRLLKDNGIDMAAVRGSPMLKLAKSLPFEDPEGVNLRETGS